jgi:hypothetical protein
MGMGMEKRRLFLQTVNDVINNDELKKSHFGTSAARAYAKE